HTESNPEEAGLGFTVKLAKGYFIGKPALERGKAQGITRKLCCLTLDDPSVALLGKEPILAGDHVLGYVTSANYGYTMRQSIAYGYLPLEYAREGTPVEVCYLDDRLRATVQKEPLHLP